MQTYLFDMKTRDLSSMNMYISETFYKVLMSDNKVIMGAKCGSSRNRKYFHYSQQKKYIKQQ